MVINGLFKYAKYEENIPCLVTTEILKNVTFPSGAFQQSKSKIDNLQVLKLSEIELIRDRLKKSTNLKDLGILLTLDTGLRIGELCTLKKEDYKDNCLHITRSEQRNKKEGYHIGLPKGKKSRIVELSDHAETIVKTIISLTEGDGYMFPDEKRGWIRSYLFDKALRRLCDDIDIPQRSMHKLRKTYASYLLNACNLSDKMVQKQLGHLDISTTHASYNYDIFDREDKQSSFKNIKVGRM